MSKVVFNDYSVKVIDSMDDKILAVLEECAGEIESRAKRNSRVRSEQTKNSFQHFVDAETKTAFIGSNFENAIWEEYGTGEYALEGNGRKGGWSYKDEKGNWHHTTGKTPSRAFWKAYNSLKIKIKNHIQNSLKGL